jgi:hypothetical protein
MRKRQTPVVAPVAQPVNRWSKRSKKSLMLQHQLEQKLSSFKSLIALEERRLQAAEVNKQRQAGLVTDGQAIYRQNLEASISEIGQRKGTIAAYEDQVVDLQRQIDALTPTPEQALERSQRQAKLARLAKERLELTAAIDTIIEDLKRQLQCRVKLGGKMVKLAREIDFEISGDFDSKRFDALLNSLPGKLEPESLSWVKWFLGIDERFPCTIRHETDSFPETLVAPNFFKRGDQARLTKKERQAAEYEAPRPLTPWEAEALMKSPPRVEPEPTSKVVWGLVR